MSLKLFRVLYAFAVKRMLFVCFDKNSDCFVHLVRNNASSINFALVAFTHLRTSSQLSIVSADFSFTNHSFHASNRFAHFTNASCIFKLSSRQLKAKVEKLF